MPLIPIVLIMMWPLAEIAGFVLVGRALGVWPTLALVVSTAVLGALLLRHQGLHLLKRLAEEGRQDRDPARAVIDGAMIVVAGILLLLPGFLTDLIGLALFVPPVRRSLWSLLGRRVFVSTSYRQAGYRPGRSADAAPPAGAKIVDLDEGEFRRGTTANPSSPWAKRNENGASGNEQDF